MERAKIMILNFLKTVELNKRELFKLIADKGDQGIAKIPKKAWNSYQKNPREKANKRTKAI